MPTDKYYPALFERLPSQENKTVVITGTTSGTGFHAAIASAQKGAKVFVLNRSSERAKKSLEKLKETVPSGEFEWIECDLQDFESVKKAGEELLSNCEESGIDVLCNNAGIMAMEDKATKDGYDIQMQTNHLSHFMLSSILYPLLKKVAEAKGEARIVNHSSGARLTHGKLLDRKYLEKNGGNLGGNGSSLISASRGARWVRYQQTKLANSVFTVVLQKRLDEAGSKVKVFCAEPGLSATELQVNTKRGGGLGGLTTWLFMKLAQSAADGACGILTGMFDPDAKPGGLYGPGTLTGPAKLSDHGKLTTPEAGKMLWEASEEACGNFAAL